MRSIKVLVMDIGGTHVKLLATGHLKSRKFPSGKMMTPAQLVVEVKAITRDWKYDVVSMGYPGVVRKNRILAEPHNLGRGWTRFNFRKAFGCPVSIINDAAMQALGSYRKGILLFLGLGTGLGFVIVSEGVPVSVEAANLSYKGGSFEHYMGNRGLQRMGLKKWSHAVALAVKRLAAAIHPDDIVIGGGNALKLTKLPKGCRLGNNKYAFTGGFRMWQGVTPTKKRNRIVMNPWFGYGIVKPGEMNRTKPRVTDSIIQSLNG